ncbi:MAG: hypothetical protein ACT4O3_05665, partial [Elusimicrobiota bacterium]
HDRIKSDRRHFIASAGMHDGWYDGIQGDKIQNKNDIIPNVGPDVGGESIGAKLTVKFGGGESGSGGIIRRQAAGKPGVLALDANHNYIDYFVQDQLIRMREPPTQDRGISVKDPNFQQRLMGKVAQ